MDLLAKECYKEKGVVEKLKEIFPLTVFKDQTINFRELGKIVFNDLEKLKKLEEILYPCLIIKVERVIEKAKNCCVLDGIKVHKTKFFKESSCNIFIKRDDKKRINALVKRDYITKERAKVRDNGIDYSGIKFDLYIDNNGSLADLKSQIAVIVAKLNEGIYCLYAGSFDPLTNGHLELIKRASKDYDYVFVGIGDNPNKKRNYDKEEMVDLINSVLKNESVENALCFGYKGYTGEVAKKLNVTTLVRGIRNEKDKKEEKVIEEYNLNHFGLKTRYYTIEGMNQISSSIVRERIKNKWDISDFVPGLIEEYINKNT